MRVRVRAPFPAFYGKFRRKLVEDTPLDDQDGNMYYLDAKRLAEQERQRAERAEQRAERAERLLEQAKKTNLNQKVFTFVRVGHFLPYSL